MTAATHSEFSIKSNFCLKDIPTSPGLCFDEEKVHNSQNLVYTLSLDTEFVPFLVDGKRRLGLHHSEVLPMTTTMFPRRDGARANKRSARLSLCWGRLLTTALLFPEIILLKTPRALITYGRLSDYIMDSNQLVHTSLTLLPLNLSLMKGQRICTRD